MISRSISIIILVAMGILYAFIHKNKGILPWLYFVGGVFFLIIGLLGIVLDYNQNHIYYALKGKGTFCNGKRLQVSNNDKLSDSIISFCLTSHYNDEHIKDVFYVEEKWN